MGLGRRLGGEDSHHARTHDPSQTYERDIPIGTELPCGAKAIITYRLQPVEYPRGCSEFTQELFAREEPKGKEYLPHGRAALVAGVTNGTVPPDCTTVPFMSGLPGLMYETQEAIAREEPQVLVKVCKRTGGGMKVKDTRPATGNMHALLLQPRPPTVSRGHSEQAVYSEI